MSDAIDVDPVEAELAHLRERVTVLEGALAHLHREVTKTRNAQDVYFRIRSAMALNEAKALETRLSRTLADIAPLLPKQESHPNPQVALPGLGPIGEPRPSRPARRRSF